MDALIDFTGGTIGGIANVYAGQSLDTVKVKLQTHPHLYKNAFQCFFQTARNEGIRGLYAGTVPSLAANIAENSVLFCSYGIFQKAVGSCFGIDKISELRLHHNALAGGLAGFVVAFALTPTELIKCRLQAMYEMDRSLAVGPNRVGPFRLASKILREDGFLTLFRGLKPTIVRESPGYLIFFTAIEGTKILLTPEGSSPEDLGTPALMLSGGMGGFSLWFTMFPFDVIKSRAQVGHGRELPMYKALQKILRNEGFSRLYKGLGPTLVRTFLATSIMYPTIVYSCRAMQYIRHQL